MQVTKQNRQTPSRASRRQQIIDAAIEVVAREGVAGASFEKIRQHAGISSTRLISYHFDSKDELLYAVVEQIVSQAVGFMQPRIAAASGALAQLDAYIRSNLGFLASRPTYLIAAVKVLSVATPEDSRVTHEQAEAPVRALLRAGRDSGELRAVDEAVAAMAIRSAIDGAAIRYSLDPQLDLTALADQLAQLFTTALVARSNEQNQGRTPP
ncbi:TetR family transcriptional regulator [Microlunatus endophyticus]|uniref:TetR family transcriptional regulator n=1 Tax=Microlunatus endophyticus TaxID=1716077 RepID=A0A917S7S8_9ACTN|nr:TetR/AcrR family transcriptional regulator [Microlunatus endophyticus]GGL60553.1 TetR family transcriptional regulator [Microlunatus endophyticus]